MVRLVKRDPRDIVLCAILTVSFACESPGSSASSDTVLDASDATDADIGTPAMACLTAVPCATDEDCPPGTRCNDELGAPMCQTIHCGRAGTVCSDDAHCEIGLRCDESHDPPQCLEDAPATLVGVYLMGVATVVDPTKPLRFQLRITDGVSATLQAFAVPPSERAGNLVGNVFVATGELRTDLTMSFDFGLVEVPVEANPILPSSATVALRLVTPPCSDGAQCLCGLASGDITAPAAIPLAGSTWGTTIMSEGTDPLTSALVVACPD